MLWSTPGWLPEEIGIIVEQGQFFCYEGEDLKLHLQRGYHNITVYSLIGMAVNIESGNTQKAHLVAMVNGMSITLSFYMSSLTCYSCPRRTRVLWTKSMASFQ
jgi:hypothetical protein